MFRVSYKPLDLSFVTKYISTEKLEDVFPIEKLKNAKVQINLLQNIISINIYDIENYKQLSNKYGFQIVIPEAKEVNIGLNATKLIKKELEFKYITFNNAKISLLLNKSLFDFKFNNIKAIESTFLPNKLEILNSELGVYFPNKTGYLTAKKADITVSNQEGNIQIKNIRAEKVDLLEKNKQIALAFNKPNFSYYNNIFEGIVEDVRVSYFNDKNEIKKIFEKVSISFNDFIFKNLKIKYDTRDEFNLNSDILYNGILIPTKAKGKLSRDLLVDAKIDFELKQLKLFRDSTKLDLVNSFTVNNLDRLSLEGKVTVEILQSKFLASKFDIKSINKDSILLAFDNFDYRINNFLLKAKLAEDELDISQLLINRSNDEINIKGNVDSFINNTNAQFNINFKKLSLLGITSLINNNINRLAPNSFKITNLESGNLENINLKILYSNDDIAITELNGKVIDTKFSLENDIKITMDEAIFDLQENNKVILDSKNIFFKKNNNIISFSNNIIELDSLFDIEKTSFTLNSKMNVEFKRLLSLLDIKDKFPSMEIKEDYVSGNINSNIKISYSPTKANKLNYSLSGNITDLSLKNKNDFPVILENFNGDISYKNNLLKINGNALLNKSESKIQIKLNKNYKLLVNVDSTALFNAFDFLEEYNFLKSGTSKVNIIIEKNNLFHDDWKATLAANLYNNNVNISQVVYEKKKKKQGWLNAIYHFNKLSLTHVENLTFFTEDILIRGDLILNDEGDVDEIKVKEFQRELDNFSANINLEKKDYFTLNVFGKSINVNNFFSENNNNKLSGKVDIFVESLHFNNLNFGKTKITSDIFNNNIVRLNGQILHNEIKYAYFKYILNKKENSEFKLTFLNFGLFMKNMEVSDKFILGSGDIVFSLDNLSNEIQSGKYLIKNFSIKDASFLARLLQLASFTGLLEILANEGIPFTNLQGAFNIDKSIIKIDNTRFEGLSLGASTTGSINLKNKELDLEGVLIPAYAINTIINKIPLLGKIITGIEGEGIIGFNYKVLGNYENPEYTINPFSVLTPGIIRSIFKVFGDDNKKEKKEESPS
ncbi:MAG: hypothetical protein CBC53_004165 [Alphaproteobacteria bacterium TMED93]|nr:MAG: hypothetical protein CBC53_004165 [Alphaproteobacteria bacterium TMED93]